MTEYKIGDTLPDGTIYAGQRKDGLHFAVDKIHNRMFNHDDALEFVKKLDAHGHKDWVLPDREEGALLYAYNQRGKLKELFSDGQFVDGSRSIWLSEVHASYADYAWNQWFGDGFQFYDHRDGEFSVRPVRRFQSFNDLNISMADWAVLSVTRGGTVSLIKGLTETEADILCEKLNPSMGFKDFKEGGQLLHSGKVSDGDMQRVEKFRSSEGERK